MQAIKSIPNLRLIIRTKDRGLVPAIREGIAAAKYEQCLWMDADLTMSPSQIPDFIEQIVGGADLVVGSRYIAGGGMKGVTLGRQKTPFNVIIRNLCSSEDSLLSVFISKWGNKTLRAILRSTIHDFSSGFFACKKDLLKSIPIEGAFVDYCISLPYRAIMKGFNVVEIPMVLATRQSGTSKTSNSLWCIIRIAYQCFKKAIVLRFTIPDEREGIHV